MQLSLCVLNATMVVKSTKLAVFQGFPLLFPFEVPLLRISSSPWPLVVLLIRSWSIDAQGVTSVHFLFSLATNSASDPFLISFPVTLCRYQLLLVE